MLTVGCGFQVRLWTAREARVVGGIMSLEATRNKKGRFTRKGLTRLRSLLDVVASFQSYNAYTSIFLSFNSYQNDIYLEIMKKKTFCNACHYS